MHKYTHIIASLKGQEESNRLLQPQTGLVISTYFCALKMRWMLDNVSAIQDLVKLDSKRLAFGTVESWILFNLTQDRVHKTDITNASRTLLFNLNTLAWDEHLMEIFEIRKEWLPSIHSNAENFGKVSAVQIPILADLPITGLVGDQHAALLAHNCIQAGQIKITYGTGCFILMNAGYCIPNVSKYGLLSTIAFQLGSNKQPMYAVEGSISICGKYLDWLRDILGLSSPAEMDELAINSDLSSDSVMVFPTLCGIFAPYWCSQLRGSIQGLSLHSTRADICRASIEAICFQAQQMIECIQEDQKNDDFALHVDGGITKSKVCMTTQANICQKDIIVYHMSEFTSLGAAIAAGLGIGIWREIQSVPYEDAFSQWSSRVASTNSPKEIEQLQSRYKQWKTALDKTVVSIIDASTL